MFDLVIKDAEIHDGSGAKPVHGDLGVRDGKIAAIGPRMILSHRDLLTARCRQDGRTHRYFGMRNDLLRSLSRHRPAVHQKWRDRRRDVGAGPRTG